MATLVKKNGGMIPSVFSDLFDTEKFFSTNFFEGGLTFPKRWVPAVNIVESPKEFKITLSAPGMKKDDFKINVENDLLTISAEKEDEKKVENARYTRREYSYGSFARSFSIPEGVNTEKIDAHYENGILSLTFLKKEDFVKKSKAREIPVR